MRSAMKNAEIAIRARQRVVRAPSKRTPMLNEAVSNHMDEVLARVEADRALKAPARLVKVCGEAVDLDDLDFSCPPSDKEWAVLASRRFEYGTQDSRRTRTHVVFGDEAWAVLARAKLETTICPD